MGGAKVAHSWVCIVELKHVKPFDWGNFMHLYGPGINGMVQDIGSPCFLGLIDIFLHDHRAVLIPKIPWNQAGGIHRGEVDFSIISTAGNFLSRYEEKIIPYLTR